MAADVSIRPARGAEELSAVLDVSRRVSGGPAPSVAELEHVLANEAGSTFLLGYYGQELAASGERMFSALSAPPRSVGREHLFGRVREDDGDSMSAAVQARGFREIGRDF